jgi:hypothetical protein
MYLPKADKLSLMKRFKEISEKEATGNGGDIMRKIGFPFQPENSIHEEDSLENELEVSWVWRPFQSSHDAEFAT